MRRFLFILFLLCLLIGSVWLYLTNTYPATPISTSAGYLLERLLTPPQNYKKDIIGFLPYWRLDQSNTIPTNKLSEIDYFSLTAGDDGHLLTVINGQTDPGWNGWKKQSTKDFLTKAQIMGAKVTFTVAAQDNTSIENILNSNAAQQNLISDTINQIKERNLNGVNIDFEYSGVPTDALQQEFTYFSKKLATKLKQQNPHATLTLSIMPLSARQQDLYDFKQIVPIYDQFIGMSYDYYGQTSDIAGPVAPMNGFKQGAYFFDVTTTYADYLKYIPKNKLIMGVPTYGWEWGVTDGKMINSKTYPADSPDSYTAVISYARAREDSDLKQNQCQWDTVSQESWCWFTDRQTGTDHQAWIVDNKMLQTRFDFANTENFSGVALWTLGLDENYPDIWDNLRAIFGT
jgi:spore germination protein YaaH